MNSPATHLANAGDLYQAAGARVLAASQNPFDQVVPDFSVFGTQFTQWWQKLLGGAWGVALVLCAFHLITTGASLQSNKKNGYQSGVMEDTTELKKWGVGAGVTIGAGVIFGAAVAVFG